MSTPKINRPSNGKPILPSSVENMTNTVKLDKSSIDSLIKGIAGVVGQKRLKDVKKDEFSIKNLSDSIIKKLDECNNKIYDVICSQLSDKVQAIDEAIKKLDGSSDKNGNDFQKQLITELIGSDSKSGLGLTNFWLESIAQGIYYINDAIYGNKKWKSKNNISTTAIKASTADKENSILGIISSKTTDTETINTAIGGKASKNDVLKSAVNTFLAIVDDLDNDLKKGSLKSVSKNFKPEEFVSILNSLKIFSTELADLNLPTIASKNPLSTISDIFGSIESIKNYDYYSTLDSINELNDFLVKSDFSKQLKTIFTELNNINNILTSSKNTPQVLYKNFSFFAESLNTLFDLVKNINFKALLKAKAKSIILSNSKFGLAALFNPIIDELLRLDEKFNKNQKEISNFSDNVEIINLYVFKSLERLSNEANIKSVSKLIIYGALASKSFNALQGLIKSIKIFTKELDGIDFKDQKESLKTINTLATVVDKLSSLNKAGSSLFVTAIPAIIGFKTAGKSFNALQGLINAANELNTEDIKFASENLEDISKLVLCIGGVMLLGAALGSIVVARFKEILAFSSIFATFTICIIGAVNLSTQGLEKTLNNAKEVGTLIVMLAGLMMFSAVTGMFVLKHSPAILGFAITLGAFIFLTVSAINIATRGAGGLRYLENSAKAIIGIVAVSATIMLLGGTLFMSQPKLIIASLAFAVTLGSFVWLLTSAVSFGAKSVRNNAAGLVLIMAFEILSASVLLFPGMMITRNPNLAIACATWAALTWGYTKAMARIAESLTRNSKEFVQGMVGLALLGLFNTEMATSMWILVKASEELAIAPDGTSWAGIGVILAAGGMLLAEKALIKTLGKLDKSDLIKGTATLAALGGIMIEVSAAMYLWTEVAKNVEDKDTLLEVIALASAMIAAETMLIEVISKLSVKNLGAGVLVLEGLTLISGQVAGMMNSWVDSAIKFDGKQTAFINVIGSAALMLTGMTGIVAILGGIAFAGGGIGAAVLASGGVVMEGLILLSMQLASMMNMWVGVVNAAKRLDGFDVTILNGVFEAIGTSAASLINTFKGISILELLKVCGAASTLGVTISTIASGVAEAANMHYTKYENGKKIGEFNLTREDFAKAAENTKHVVSTLGNAIIEIYDENPEIFGNSTDIAGLLGLQTKFGKVCKSTMLLGQVISQIADGVVHMANLSYTKYVNGKSVGTFNLTAENFTAAAVNTKKVIKTLGQAIIDVYDENPEMFQFKSGTLYGALGLDTLCQAFGAETPFAKACNSVALLGNLISTIADSVIKMANGDVKYYENGQEKHRNITPDDYKAAADNTNMIIKTLGQAVIDSYKKNPELFSSGSGIGDALGFNPKFKNIIDTVGALGTMIKNIADGIQTFANGAVPVYGKNGEVIDKRPISQQDYDNAAACIQSIISTLGRAIMRTYDSHQDWFTDKSIGAWFTGGNPSDTPFGQTVTALSNMSKLIGEYAKQVQDFAKGSIPFYGLDGKVLTYVPMTKDTYKQAGDSIGLVISTMAESLEKTYKDHKDLFDEDNWKPMESALTSLSKLIGIYANSIKNFAGLTIDIYDDNGQAIGKKNLTTNDIKITGENIKTVMSTMINAVWEVYKTKKQLFEAVNDKSSKNWFTTIVTASSKSGKLISSLASAVKNYANMRVDKYDENGNKVGTRAFTDDDFLNAGRHIGMILTSTTSAIDTVYKEHKDLFENAVNFSFEVQNNSNPFAIVAQAGAKAGQMISYCAKGVSDVANIKDLNNQVYIKQVQSKVKNLISALAFAVQETYTEISKSNDNIFINANDKNSIINRIYSAIMAVSKMTSDVSKVYDSLSKMNTDALSKVVGSQSDHSDNLIYKMIKGLAQPIIDIFNDTTSTNNGVSVNNLFGNGNSNDTLFIRIQTGINQVAKMMETIQSTYEAVSKINIDISGSETKIKGMINGLANPIISISNDDKTGIFGNAGSTTDKILNGIFNVANNLTTAGIISSIINGVKGTEKAPDTPFGRVVSGIASELKIISSIIAVYDSVSKIDINRYKVDKDGNLTIFTTLINGLTTPIINYGKDEKTQEAIEKGVDDINDVIKDIADIFIDEDSGILSIYKTLANIKLPENIGPGGVLTQLMKGVIDSINNSGLNEQTEKIKNSLEDCFDEFDEIFNDEKEGLFSIYRNLNRLITETSGKTNSELVQTLQGLMQGVNRIMSADFIGNILSVDTFNLYNRVNTLNSAMEGVYKMYTNIPALNKDLEYFIPYLQNLQNTVGVVPNIKEFEQETNTLTKFNNSVNSLRIQNVKALQNLMIELNKFGAKFGNLDKFTEVLATKLSNCLTYLADQIRDSAKIVDKTGELNEARKKQIQETIKQFETLANQGINVFVQQGSTDSTISVSSTNGSTSSTTQTSTTSDTHASNNSNANTKAIQSANRTNAAGH